MTIRSTLTGALMFGAILPTVALSVSTQAAPVMPGSWSLIRQWSPCEQQSSASTTPTTTV